MHAVSVGRILESDGFEMAAAFVEYRYPTYGWLRIGHAQSSNASYQYIRLGFKGDDLAEMRLKDSFGNQTTIKFNNLNTHPNLSRG